MGGPTFRRSRGRALTRRLRDRERQQAAVASLGQSALVTRDLPAFFADAVTSVATTIDCHIVNVVRADPSGTSVFVATHGWEAGVGDRAPFSGGPVSQALQLRLPLLLHSTADLDQPARGTLEGLGVRSSAVVLVGDPSRPWGALVAHGRTPDAFSPDDVNFLQSVANVIGAVVARAEVEAEVRHRASHDTLTGLPARELFRERLDGALRDGGCVGLLLVDLDGFKDINDSLGHHVGDLVLEQVAARLLAVVGPGGTVGRLGGDEFAMCLERTDGAPAAAAVAARVVAGLARPYETGFGAVTLTGSVGGAVGPRDGREPGELLKHADLAMYRAKREQLGHTLYDPVRDEDPLDRRRSVDDLRTAIAERALTLAYQPVVDLLSHAVTSAEALCRWTHPQLGPQSPDEFIALAESAGLIGELTDEVLRMALDELARLLRAGRVLPLAVNLPGSVLARSDFPDELAGLLAVRGLDPRLLKIEVTETTLVSEGAVTSLRRINGTGVRVGIDDFGMGYSSLARLKELPVQTLKVDRSFVTGLDGDARDLAIVEAIVAMAGALRLNVIAEGVETARVARVLRGIGVPRVQGFLYSRGLPAEELDRWRAAWAGGGWADPRVAPPELSAAVREPLR